MTPTAARIGHGMTAVVGIFAIVAQLVLVFVGTSVLIEEDRRRWPSDCADSCSTSPSRATSSPPRPRSR